MPHDATPRISQVSVTAAPPEPPEATDDSSATPAPQKPRLTPPVVRGPQMNFGLKLSPMRPKSATRIPAKAAGFGFVAAAKLPAAAQVVSTPD